MRQDCILSPSLTNIIQHMTTIQWPTALDLRRFGSEISPIYSRDAVVGRGGWHSSPIWCHSGKRAHEQPQEKLLVTCMTHFSKRTYPATDAAFPLLVICPPPPPPQITRMKFLVWNIASFYMVQDSSLGLNPVESYKNFYFAISLFWSIDFSLSNNFQCVSA